MHTLALLFRAAGAAGLFFILTLSTGSSLRAQLAAPPAPINLASSVNGSTVALTWQPGVTGGPSSSYRIDVGSRSGASDLGVVPTSTTSVQGTGVPAGTYFVRVFAVNASGASGPSNELAINVGGCTTPSAPANFAAQASGQVVTMTWGPVSGASGYRVAAGLASGLANVATVPVNGLGITGSAPPGIYYTRVHSVSPCGISAPSNEVVVNVDGGQPGQPIWGAVDPSILGTCSAAVHDRYVLDGGDGYRYRTWHPQTVAVDATTSCTFGHEHGDDPASQANPGIAAQPVRFGYVGRRHPMPGEPNGHEEPHEGFKVFVANRGRTNEEHRTHLHDTRIVFHMGTGGPRRFTMPHHSMEYTAVTADGRFMQLQAMADTGGVSNICAQPREGKTVVSLDTSCRLGSLYEIWTNKVTVRGNGQVIAQAVASTAVFDPITALDPANPTRLLYIWDPALVSIKQFPTDDWSTNRGCDREAYHGPTYWYNSSNQTTFWTDAMGNEVPASHPLALGQVVSQHDTHGQYAASVDGNETFKLLSRHCGQRAALGPKN